MMYQPKSKTVAALAGSLLLALALGCQTPATTTVPKVAVSLGTLQWSSEADLAILLDFRPLLNMRKLQATNPVGPVATIEAKVTGDNIVGEIVAPVIQTAFCPSGTATINFEHLPSGHVKVVVNAYDAAHQLITFGKGEADILAGEVKTVNVTCQAADSGLNVIFDCPQLCATPVSTPTPAQPIDPSDLGGHISTFDIDASGNLYLVTRTTDPVYRDDVFAGRMIKVDPGHNTHQIQFDHTELTNDMNVIGSVAFNYMVYQGGVQRIDLGSTPGAELTPRLQPGGTTTWLMAKTSDHKLLTNHAGTSNVGIYRVDPANPAVQDEIYLHDNGAGTYTPKGCLIANEYNLPMWTASGGICEMPGTTAPSYAAPVVLTDPADAWAKTAWSLAHASTPTTFFVTEAIPQADTKVYLWDKAAPATHTVATDLAPYYPRLVRHGDDGAVYVLAFKDDQTYGVWYWETHDKYEIVKYTLSNNTLVNPRVVVSTF
ncbi:MAG: hypothetical protein JWM80_732 [Cyanobacteria bacterium RYN_339]|nr:hypothetical protein [Cyanobacteria bacterium RYN_339]